LCPAPRAPLACARPRRARGAGPPPPSGIDPRRV